MGIGTAVASNHMWYHYYIFFLLPLFVWIAWSRFHPWVIAWCFVGLTTIQLESWLWPQGLLPHLFAHLSMVGILAWQIAHTFQATRRARVGVGAGALAALFILGLLLYDALDANANLAAARRWLDANLPKGAVIAVEPYGPTVSRKYSAAEFQDLLAQPAAWYEQNGWEYVVTGYGTHSGASLVPTFEARPAGRYVDFLSRFSLVTRLATDNHAIGIYKTGATGPARRVSARFGFLGEWLDLVGYDVNEARRVPGDPLRLTFHWRAVQQKRYPLQLTVRLLDPSDRAIATSVGNLLGAADSNERWPIGITRVPWQIAVPATAAPGLYRVELDVDCIGMGRMPVLPFADQPFSDKLYLEPFKISPPAPSQDEMAKARAVNARLGDALSLRGYSLPTSAARSGENLQITLYWYGIAKPDKDYTVFLHLLDASGNIRAQIDAQPLNGSYPTSIWDAGEMVRDEPTLTLPRDLAPGDYRIALGMYEYPTLARLPVLSASGARADDHLTLPDVIRLESAKP
jgi:hypothetical protein